MDEDVTNKPFTLGITHHGRGNWGWVIRNRRDHALIRKGNNCPSQTVAQATGEAILAELTSDALAKRSIKKEA